MIFLKIKIFVACFLLVISDLTFGEDDLNEECVLQQKAPGDGRTPNFYRILKSQENETMIEFVVGLNLTSKPKCKLLSVQHGDKPPEILSTSTTTPTSTPTTASNDVDGLTWSVKTNTSHITVTRKIPAGKEDELTGKYFFGNKTVEFSVESLKPFCHLEKRGGLSLRFTLASIWPDVPAVDMSQIDTHFYLTGGKDCQLLVIHDKGSVESVVPLVDNLLQERWLATQMYSFDNKFALKKYVNSSKLPEFEGTHFIIFSNAETPFFVLKSNSNETNPVLKFESQDVHLKTSSGYLFQTCVNYLSRVGKNADNYLTCSVAEGSKCSLKHQNATNVELLVDPASSSETFVLACNAKEGQGDTAKKVAVNLTFIVTTPKCYLASESSELPRLLATYPGSDLDIEFSIVGDRKCHVTIESKDRGEVTNVVVGGREVDGWTAERTNSTSGRVLLKRKFDNSSITTTNNNNNLERLFGILNLSFVNHGHEFFVLDGNEDQSVSGSVQAFTTRVFSLSTDPIKTCIGYNLRNSSGRSEVLSCSQVDGSGLEPDTLCSVDEVRSNGSKLSISINSPDRINASFRIFCRADGNVTNSFVFRVNVGEEATIDFLQSPTTFGLIAIPVVVVLVIVLIAARMIRNHQVLCRGNIGLFSIWNVSCVPTVLVGSTYPGYTIGWFKSRTSAATYTMTEPRLNPCKLRFLV